ncbi:hypothetical protein BDV59DRAFT_61449 [Aspergillus ambiguus]|uniref:uncharacterized protein n=1 Tax=Aspergillus ambiguus TaxID=176160 RepID=UPI003CCD3C4C
MYAHNNQNILPTLNPASTLIASSSSPSSSFQPLRRPHSFFASSVEYDSCRSPPYIVHDPSRPERFGRYPRVSIGPCRVNPGCGGYESGTHRRKNIPERGHDADRYALPTAWCSCHQGGSSPNGRDSLLERETSSTVSNGIHPTETPGLRDDRLFQ